MLHISIKAEKIGQIFGFPITNSLLTTYLLLVLFLIFSLFYQVKLNDKNSKFVFLTRFVTGKVYALFQPVMKDKTDLFFPLLASFFLFILLSNWFGLIPGVGSILIKDNHEKIPLLRGISADLNTTLALAIISVVLTQYYAIKYLGFSAYLKRFINLTNPMAFFTGILEIISEFSKIISFSFRLFGNIFAGEVLLSVVAFLIPVLASFPFLILELFVGLIQALVFAMLTAAFLNIALIEEH